MRARPAWYAVMAFLLLQVAAFAQNTTITYTKTENPYLYIQGPGPTVDTLWVPDSYPIVDVFVYVLFGNNITDGSDLAYTLMSPQPNRLQVRLKTAGVAGGLNTTYDFPTPSVDSMDVLDGRSTFGAWTLTITTTNGQGPSGPLKGWMLEFVVSNSVAGTIGHKQPVAGMGNPGGGGRIDVFDNDIGSFQPLLFTTLPFAAYNALNGTTRVAAGNLLGTRREQLVVGLGPSAQSNSFVAVLGDQPSGFPLLTWLRPPWSAAYDAANGETFVATGDVDGDGLDDIIVGQGRFPADGGRFAVFSDGLRGYNLLFDGRLPWNFYNVNNGEVRPAAGDVNGDGFAEVVLGLGPFAPYGGWVSVMGGANAGYQPLRWFRMPWPVYNNANGATRPACGDLDGDRRNEVVVGIDTFTFNGGWFYIADDMLNNFATRAWVRFPNVAYNAANGATRPACGDTDGDGRADILIGTGPDPGNTFNMCLFADARLGFSFRRFLTIQDAAYTAANGETWPTLGNMK